MIPKPGPLLVKRPVTLVPEAKTLVAAMTTAPTNVRKKIINDTIRGLKDAGLWTKLDVLYFMAAADSQAARLNWKLPGTYTLSAVNTPTFTADRGYTGDGATSYLDTGWSPSTNGVAFTQNSACLGCWVLTDSAANTFDLGTGTSPGLRISSRTAGGVIQALVNDATGSQILFASGNGLTIGTRPDANTVRIYRNAAQAGTDTSIASTGVGAGPAWLLRNFAVYSARQVSIAFYGSDLTASEVAVIYSLFNTYLSRVGAV